MKFPVDLLPDVSQAELQRLAHNYMNDLLHSNPDSPEHLTLSDSTQVTIDVSSVGFIPLYGSSDRQRVLALFSPGDTSTAVALYLLDQWWTVDDILKTADAKRDGAVEVETVGERIVLYILNRVIYRAKEMSSEERPFLCHGEEENAKILWNGGEAVGFYSVKPSGSLYNSVSTRSYQLPVMDSIFVRKGQRGKGFGLQMLKDFVLTFKEDCLGLRFPLTKSMYKVCEKYLCQYPDDRDLLWEVQSIGWPNQRTSIASKIQALDLTAVSKKLLFTEITEATKKDVVTEAITTRTKETKSMERTVEIVEEVTVLRATESTGSKQRTIEDKSEKVIRIEYIEAETPGEEQASAQQKTEVHNVSDSAQTEGMFTVAAEAKGEDVIDAAPEEEAATIPDKPATAPTTEEPQVDDDGALNNSCRDSQITVENVASEIEEAKCQKEDAAMLVVSEEALQLYKEAESLKGKGTQMEIADEKSTSRRRSQQPEGEATAQHGGRVLRRRTVRSTATPKCKYAQHNQEACGELEKEVNEVSATEVAQELAVTEGDKPEEITAIKEDAVAVEENQKLEQLTNEEETEEQEDPGVEDSAVKVSSTELPGRADTGFKDENEDEKVTDQFEMSLIQDKQEVSDGGQEQRDEAGLGAGGSASKEIADEKEMDNKQVGEHHQAQAVDTTEEDVSTEEATAVDEGAIEVNLEEETKGGSQVEMTAVDGECVAPEKEQMELMAAEEKVKEDGGKQGSSSERSVDATVEAAHVEKGEIEADYCDKDKEEFASVGEEEGKVNTVPVEEKQSAATETCVDVEAAIPLMDENEANRLPVEVGEAITLEEEEAPVVETRALRSGTKAVTATPRHKKTRNKTQEDKQEVENCEEEEPAVRGRQISAAATPKGESTGTCRQIQEGEGESKRVEGTGVEGELVSEEAAADDSMQDGERLTEPTTDSAILTPNEEAATPSAERQQSEEMVPQLSELQRVTVVLVDLKKGHREVQEETAAVKEDDHVAEGEEEQREEPMADENVPGCLVGIEKTLEKVVVEEEGFDEKGQDAVTTQDVDERPEETAEDEAKSADDDGEEEELADTETGTRKGRKQSIKATLRRTSARNRQKMDEEKQEASEIEKEEPAVQVRVLRRGRKSIPVTQRRTTKRTHKHNQVEEEEGREESTAEEREAEGEEEQAEEQEQMIDQEKGRIPEENNATPHVENVEPEMGIEKAPTAAGEAVVQDAPEEGRVDEGKIEGDVAVTTEDAAEQSTSPSEVAETAAGESAQETYLTEKVSEEEEEEDEAPGIQTRVLESCEKTMRATTRSRTTKRQDDEQEATGEENTEEDEPAVETRVKRRKRLSAAATPRLKSKRARTRVETETTRAEEIQANETKADGKQDSSDEKIEEKNGKEAAAQEENSTQPEVEMEKVEAVAEESVPEQETVEEDQSETHAGGQDETPTADKGKGSDDEEVPVVETAVLRSSGKAVKENEQDGTVMDSSAETDESAVETRVQRRGKRAAPATPRRKSKRPRMQYQPQEEEEQPTPAEQTGEEEEEAGQEEDGEKAENEDVEEYAAGVESAPAEEAAVPEKEDDSKAAASETGTDAVKTSSAEVEETNSAEGEEVTVTDVGSDTAIAEDEALAENDAVVAEKEAPAATIRTRASRRSRRQRVPRKYDEENEEGGTEAATEEEEEHEVETDKKGECLEDEPIEKQEESSGGENFEISSEKGDILHLVLDSDEQVEAAGLGQEEEDDGQDVSEEEVEPIVIGARDLRRRLVPSIVITPRSKSRRSHANVPEAEESLSDEGRRSSRKRKSTELTTTPKPKRHSRV